MTVRLITHTLMGRSYVRTLLLSNPRRIYCAQYLDADMETCFDRLGPQALRTTLHTFPAWRRTMPAWLQAGVRAGEARCPTDTGAPHGGVRSPLLMHVAHHGLATALTTAFPASQAGHRGRPRVIR
jgi:RNA-directed DNA polymerase